MDVVVSKDRVKGSDLMSIIVNLNLRLRLSGTQALSLSGSLMLTQAHSGSLRLLLRLTQALTQ